MRPHPYRFDPRVRTLFADRGTGLLKMDDGQGGQMMPPVGLADLLAMAKQWGARRIFLTGERPSSSSWLDEPPGDGWQAAGHFYQLRDPCGRWADRDGRVTEVRRAAAWFGEGDYAPSEARDAMAQLHALLRADTRGRVGVLASPSGTGQSLWASTIQDGQLDDQTTTQVADLIRSTSPQHREEVVGSCFDGCDEHSAQPAGDVPSLHYVDGVFMYAACTRELGGRGTLLDSPRLARAYYDAHPFGRARYRVAFTVPGDFAGPGLLPMKHPNGRNWHYPNVPGFAGETWADAAEIHLAVKHGWTAEPLALVRFDEGRRPLDTFTAKTLRMRDAAGPMAAAALRAMFIRTIGSFHSRGRERSMVVPMGTDLPGDVIEWETRENGDRVYTAVAEPSGNAAAFVRPELSSQVWARARVKVAEAMMQVDPRELVAVWGDALYVVTDPGWRGETPGTFRPKGELAEPVARPRTISELLRLREAMER